MGPLRTRRLLFLVLALGVGLACLDARNAHTEMRMVRAEVSFQGEVLLEASTSDDGSPHVDEVWNYLKKLEFSPTPAFHTLREKREAEGSPWTLERSKEEDWIRLDIAYGGRAELWKLPLLQVGESWRVDVDAIDAAAERRWIRRWEAANLYEKKR